MIMNGNSLCSSQIEESTSQNDRVSELEQQNEELRRVIRYMRRDIETLGNDAPSSVAVAPGDQVPAATNPTSVATTYRGLYQLPRTIISY